MLSSQFAAAGLNATFKMESTVRKFENSIRMGFPLGEFWIQNDLDEIDDLPRLAALAVENNTDRERYRNWKRTLRGYDHGAIGSSNRTEISP